MFEWIEALVTTSEHNRVEKKVLLVMVLMPGNRKGASSVATIATLHLA